MNLYTENKHKLLIVGAGGIGGLFGICCSKSPIANITMVCRSNFEQVKMNGFHLESCTWGKQVFYPNHVVSSIEEASKLHKEYDYVIITTKTHNAGQIVKNIKPVVSPKTCIVLIQNGLEIEAQYINQYPDNSIISVITFVGVHQMKSGYLEHFLPFKMSFGNGRHSVESYLPQDLSNITNFESIIVDSGIDYFITDQMRMVSWHKVQFNATLSVIAVIYGGITLQELLTTPHTRELADCAIREVAGLAKELFGKGFPSWLPTVETHHNQMINNSLAYKPSLVIDFEKGLPLEYESILGKVVRIANDLNYPVPICKANYVLLKQIDVKNVSKTRV